MTQEPPKAGYSKLASLMGTYPEVAIFRRFASLNALNLLHLQAELHILEATLEEQIRNDAASDDYWRRTYDRDWESLSQSTSAKDGNSEQWRLMQQVREKLNEYNQGLVFQHMVANIKSPNMTDIKFLQKWMATPDMGGIQLIGPDSEIWNDNELVELACLRPRLNDSWLSSFVSSKFIRWWHYAIGWYFKGPNPTSVHGKTVHYPQEQLTRLTMVIGTTIASVLPLFSILVLSLVTRIALRLIIIGVFSVLFSLGLGLFTNGRMIEIFSATSAFAAVQVVFVGSTSSTVTS
ncbi:hypothetical protein BX600DRAFT_95137 [Xylariales sp. PMI_506]|nr:hypothetical protein BX600DRAFT_95137 [Xylariales sp. PMI_506]